MPISKQVAYSFVQGMMLQFLLISRWSLKLTFFSYIRQMTEKNLESVSVVTSPLGTKTCLFVLTFPLCSAELSPHLKYDVKSPKILYSFNYYYVGM
jgi:hypothetical protein